MGLVNAQMVSKASNAIRTIDVLPNLALARQMMANTKGTEHKNTWVSKRPTTNNTSDSMYEAWHKAQVNASTFLVKLYAFSNNGVWHG